MYTVSTLSKWYARCTYVSTGLADMHICTTMQDGAMHEVLLKFFVRVGVGVGGDDVRLVGVILKAGVVPVLVDIVHPPPPERALRHSLDV